MKKRALLLGLALALLVAIPAAAKSREFVGDRINVFEGEPDEFPAGEPFWIAHGHFIVRPDHGPPGIYSFSLDVDGVAVVADFVIHDAGTFNDQKVVRSFWVHNFPDGMLAGEVTFTGHWFYPCLDTSCTPNELVEETAEHTVTFTD